MSTLNPQLNLEEGKGFFNTNFQDKETPKLLKKITYGGLFFCVLNMIMYGVSINTWINHNNTCALPTIQDTESAFDYHPPELTSAPSKHVVNLMDFGGMDDNFKDNILNNLDSIIVTDDDIGTTRHQISKVTWVFDDADTMLLYTSLDEIFALAANGSISEYNIANGARRLLQTQTGWLEGKVSDVVHYGSEYSQMVKEGKHYRATRDNKRKLEKATDDFIELSDTIQKAEARGDNVEELEKQLDEVREIKEIYESEKDKIPTVRQLPIEPKTVDDELRAHEIERMEKEFEEKKADEVTKFREEVNEQKEIIKQDLAETRIILNQTHTAKLEIEDELVTTIKEKDEAEDLLIRVQDEKILVDQELETTKSEKVLAIQELETERTNKDIEMDSIKMDLDNTKFEIEKTREALDELIENEQDPDKKIIFNEINSKLQDTSGKISFTQLQMDEGTLPTFDDVRENEKPMSGESSASPDVIESWSTEEVSDKISKSCKTVRSDDPTMTCVCTHKETRDVTRC